MIIEGLKKFFSSCPYFLNRNVEIDFLDKDVGSYSINTVECQPLIKKYASGESLCQFIFTISGRENYYTEEATDISSFYENLADWIKISNTNNILPQLDDNKIPQKIEVLSSGHLFSDNINSVGYMLKCRLIYLDNL